MGSKNHIIIGIIRLGRVVLLGITLALIGNGSGALFTNSVTPGYFWDGTVNLVQWSDYSNHIVGQYVVFFSCLVLAVISAAMAIGALFHKELPCLVAIVVNSLGACAMLLGGILEMWYATGWTDRAFSPTLIIYRVNSWYASSVFFLFTLATFVGDIILVMKA